MGLLKTLNGIRAGYPGGWKQYARGTQGNKTSSFVLPTDPDDRRSLIPPLGLREYWYPALPAKDVGGKKPVGLRICGIDLVFFRDTQGAVQALWDYCPHRGAYLSWGDCFWKGYVSCPYHGATFDGQGKCVEFITEGPESKMPGRLKARKFPTVTLKGIVFVWMGEGEPAPIEEDVPPEFFDDKAMLFTSWQYWDCNWIPAMDNVNDAHIQFWVHRDSLNGLRSRYGFYPRTPIPMRTKLVNNRAVITVGRGVGADYYAKDGKLPHQLYYPRIDGYWPLHRWRLLWVWFFERLQQRPSQGDLPEEWREGVHLPTIIRMFPPSSVYMRWSIPVEANLTRIFHTHIVYRDSKRSRIWERAFWPIHKWVSHFHFSNQDYRVIRSIRYQYPEFLSSTDAYVVMVRKLIAEHGRGLPPVADVERDTAAERLVGEANELLAAKPGS